ncbi:MAG: OmpA family protein [Bacteroidia bacterium]
MKAFAWIVTILYCLLALYVWMCPVKGYCPQGMGGHMTADIPPVILPPRSLSEAKLSGSFAYPIGSAEPRYDEAFQKSLVAQAKEINAADNQIFSIVGQYGKTEKFDGENANLGLARSLALKSLLVGNGADSSRIIALYETVHDSVVKKGESIEYPLSVYKAEFDNKWLDAQETTNVFLMENSRSGIELDGLKHIYLGQIALFLQAKQTNTITITGHTSSVGTASDNEALGLENAESFKKLLVQTGFSAEQIKVASKGESELIKKPEQTESDRRKNRRVVISLNK